MNDFDIINLEAEINELQRDAARGARALAVVQTDCFKVDLKAYIEKRKIDVSEGSVWRPGCLPEIGAVALGCAYNGGRQDECQNMVNIFEIWVEQGKSAAEKINKAIEKLARLQKEQKQ